MSLEFVFISFVTLILGVLMFIVIHYVKSTQKQKDDNDVQTKLIKQIFVDRSVDEKADIEVSDNRKHLDNWLQH